MIRLADRKGILKGNLHFLQEEALQWLMLDEVEQEVNLEKERMKYTILAGNPHLWKELYSEDEEPNSEDIEWIVPKSIEEIEQIMKILDSQQIGGEKGS